MNFGVNLYNWLLSNAQPLVLVAIVVIGLYLGFKREFTKLIGFLVVAMLSVGLVFNAAAARLPARNRSVQTAQSARGYACAFDGWVP